MGKEKIYSLNKNHRKMILKLYFCFYRQMSCYGHLILNIAYVWSKDGIVTDLKK